MPTSEFEKKIHLWASLICCFGSCRCLVRVGSICNLLELDLQMPGRGWKHLQLAGIGFADAYPGFGSICNLLELDLQMPGRGWKHLQLAGIGFVDAYPGFGSICNLLELDLQMPGRGWKHLQFAGYEFVDTYPGVGSICNLLELDLQMPGQGWKHLQFAGIGFADAWPGLEASAICWNWICRCLVGVGSICNLLELDLQMPGRTWKHLQLAGIGFADAWSGLEASATCWNWMCRCLARVGSICNLLELDLQMPGQDRKHLQFASIGAADAWSGLEASTTCWI